MKKAHASLTMSDATPPPLRSSSVPDTQPIEASERVSSNSDVFPFLVHSQESVTNGKPPEVDNGRLARQKRRRTRYVYSPRASFYNPQKEPFYSNSHTHNTC